MEMFGSYCTETEKIYCSSGEERIIIKRKLPDKIMLQVVKILSEKGDICLESLGINEDPIGVALVQDKKGRSTKLIKSEVTEKESFLLVTYFSDMIGDTFARVNMGEDLHPPKPQWAI